MKALNHRAPNLLAPKLLAPPPPPPPHHDAHPEWCRCGNCREIATPVENKCCTKRRNACITHTQLFTQLVLDAHELDVAMNYRADLMAANPNRDNDGFRHAAYRQYILWQHGRLGAGNRRVIPSRVVWPIRDRFPSPNGVYTGYRPNRL